jgi:thioredoxin reductase (NADPH)
MVVDVVIIGAGPIGLATGIEAARAGLSYLIIEKGKLVNSIFNYPLNMTFFSTSERLEIGGVPFISHLPKPNRVEALEYYRRVCMTHELKLKLYEEVTSISSGLSGFVIQTTRAKYEARKVVLALGFYDRPFLLQVPGENLPKVRHYYDEPHPYFNQDVIVVGAANSAVDVALETWRKGARVTMVIRETGLRDSVKYWVKPDIENRISEGSIKACFNSAIKEIHEREVIIETPDGQKTLPNDFVLAMTGYEPPFEFMRSLGIKFGSDKFHTPIYDEATMETNVPGVYLAGVICGGLKTNKWFIENSRIHAPVIIDGIRKKLQQ